MHRTLFLLGSLVAVFSFVYFLFGVVGWVRGDTDTSDIILCFLLGTVHVLVGVFLVLRSVRALRRERRNVEHAVRRLLRMSGGKITVAELSEQAGINEDDAREYLSQRSRYDVMFHLGGRNGGETYYFGQEYWNN